MTESAAASPRSPPCGRIRSIRPSARGIDPYYWLRDDERKIREVLAYLSAENAYTERSMAAVKPLEDALYDEIVGRLKQDDSSVPYRKSGYWY